MNEDNKSPMQSKKFIFSISLNCAWLALIGYGIRTQLDPGVLEAMVYSAAFTQGLYLGGQSAVDSICRYATRKFSGILKRDNE
jgi:hypothetical protein